MGSEKDEEEGLRGHCNLMGERDGKREKEGKRDLHHLKRKQRRQRNRMLRGTGIWQLWRKAISHDLFECRAENQLKLAGRKRNHIHLLI